MRKLRTRRLRFMVYGTLASLLIAAAAVMGLAGLAFPWVLDHPERVAAFLAERLKREVSFGRLGGEWQPNGPFFVIEDLRIGGEGDADPLVIPTAELKFDAWAPFKRGVSWQELRIVGVTIDVRRDADGRWQLEQWRDEKQGAARDFGELDGLGNVRIVRSRMNLRDDLRGNTLVIRDIDIDLVPGTVRSVISGRLNINAGTRPVVFRCEGRQSWSRIQCYLEAKGFDPAAWTEGLALAGLRIRQGEGDFGFWMDLRDGKVRNARLDWQLRALVLAGQRPVSMGQGIDVEPRFSLDASSGSIRFASDAFGERLDILEGAEADAVGTRINVHRTDDRIIVRSDQVDLGRFARFATVLEPISPKLAGWLFEAAPSGRLTGLDLVVADGTLVSIEARASELGMRATRRSPALENLAGRIHGDAGAVFFTLDGTTASAVDYPHVFGRRVPVVIEELRVAVMRGADRVRIEAWPLRLRGEGFALAGFVASDLQDGAPPLVDLGIEVFRSDIVAAKDFWPLNTMPPRTVRWLNEGLKSGWIDSGHAILRGHPSDWPFLDQQGRFEAIANVADVDLHYAEGWPDGRLHRATARFVNRTMNVRLDGAEVLGNRISGGTSTIADMKDPVLTLDVAAVGDGANLLALMRQSPLSRRYGEQLAGLSIGGVGEVDLSLAIPLRPDLGEPQVDGRVRLRQADLVDEKWQLRFGQAYGNIRFSEAGFSADGLHVLLGEDLAQLSIATGSFVADPATHLAEASLRGTFPAQAAMSGFTELNRLWPHIQGKAEWDLGLTIDRPVGEAPSAKHLTIASDLRGITLALPAPLSKDAETALPLALGIGLPARGNALELELGNLMRMVARLPDDTQPFGGTIQFGSAPPPPMPAAGIDIVGDVAALDLGAWAGLIGSLGGPAPATPGAGAPETMPVSVAITAAEMNLLGRAFADTALVMRQQDDAMQLEFDGPGIKGAFRIPDHDRARRGLTARFERLHWPEATPGLVAAKPATPLDPRTLPPLHLWVRDLKLGASQFGEARVETRPDDLGMRIDQFDTRSPVLTVRGNGWWRLTPEGERSGLDITFSSEDLGKMLGTLGYAGLVDGGQTVARLNGDWAGSPAQFGLPQMVGALTGEVGPGRIVDVNPGAGRLFGLVNFAAIPRRLTLDFRDFFEKGMAFDSIQAGFRLQDGDAFTDDLAIDSPSAEIRVTGRVGLRARDYDQVMSVRPRVGGALPVVGAVTAGPVGALAGVIAQGVLKKPLDEMASATYQVQGSWDEPKITLLSKTKPAPAPPPAAKAPTEGEPPPGSGNRAP